jgi:ABC-type multidrug transport system ATPase subunit
VDRLRLLRDSRTIVLLTTHDLDLVDGLLDQAVFLRDGRVVDVQRPVTGLRERYRQLVAGGGRA